jgi:hypothetical protein
VVLAVINQQSKRSVSAVLHYRVKSIEFSSWLCGSFIESPNSENSEKALAKRIENDACAPPVTFSAGLFGEAQP